MGLPEQAEMLGNRLKKTFKRLHQPFEKRSVGAFRLYDRDIPELRLVIDWYEGHLVVAEYARTQTDAQPGWLAFMGQAAAQALGVPAEKLHLKTRRTRPEAGLRYAKAEVAPVRLAVREGPLRFWVELEERIDTGLFADHRETRARIREESAGKRVLNLFGYTGGFTCAAAKGSATATVTVDASRTYLRWAQDNLELNGLAGPRHQLVRQGVAEWLEEAAKRPERFELCVLDPPSFSTREDAKSFEVQRDHPALVAQALSLLVPGGVLYFSVNHQRFEPRLDGFSVTEITKETVPVDYRNSQVHRSFRLVAP